MSEPTTGGSTEIGKAHYVVDLKDNTDAGLKQMQSHVEQASTSTRRQLQQTAQIARNSISVVTRSVGSNITNTVLEPIISVGESFLRVAENVEVSGTRMQKSIKGIQLASGGLLGAGIGLTLLGAREKQATDQLSNAIQDLGLNTEDYSKHIEEVVSEQEKFGHTAIQTTQALQLLTSATHDPTAALDDMGEVANLAASRHISLDQAARQVAITIGGGGRLLKQYNIDIIKNTDGTRNYAAMNAQLADVLHGQAAAAVNNFGGEIRQTSVELEDFVAKFGQKFGPAITAVSFPLLALSSIVDIFATVKAKRMIQAATTISAAVEEESASTSASTDAILAALEAQTAAAESAAAAFLSLSTAAGSEGAAAALSGAAGAGSVGLTSAAEGAAVGVSESEQVIIAETGRMQAFWDEVMANMAADIDASASSITAAISEEEASLAQFTAMFNEAYDSMMAASAAATDEEVVALGALSAAQEGATASTTALGESSLLMRVGMSGLGTGILVAAGALVVGAAAYETWNFFTEKGTEATAKQIPPLDAFTEALKENYGALNQVALAKIDDAASTNGLLKALQIAGVSQEEFNKAITSGPAAVEALVKRIQSLADVTKDGGRKAAQMGLAMGGSYDDIALNITRATKTLTAFGNEVTQKTRMTKDEVLATSNLTAAQVAQAEALHISIPAYAAIIQSITDKTGKQATEQEQNIATIAASEHLSAMLGLEDTAYNSLTSSLLSTVSAQQQFNASLQGVEELHTFLDPAVTAYQQWRDAAFQLSQAQNSAAESAASAAHAVEQARQQESDAEKNVTAVRRKGREDVAKAEEALGKAHDTAASKVVAANQKIVTAEAGVKKATQDVTDARVKAEKQIVDSIRTLRDMAEGEQKARDDLLTAQLDAQQKAHDSAQDALNASTGLTQQQLIDRQKTLDDQQKLIDAQRNSIAAHATSNAVTDAQHKLNDLLHDDVQARLDAQKVIKEGISKNPDVVKALGAQKAAEEAVSKAVKDRAKAEKDAQQTIIDAEHKVADAKRTASKNNADAAQKERDAEYALTQTLQQQHDQSIASSHAIDTATRSLDASRLKLTEVEIQTGQTDTSLQRLQRTMSRMDKSLTLKYEAVGVKATGQATVDLQRAVEEVLLEAGGYTPAAARKKALSDIPNWGSVPNLGAGRVQGHGGAGQRTPVTSFTGGEIRGPGGPTSDDVPAMLSNNEHVWTAAEVQAAGGHETVRRLRQAALEGAIQEFAAGGAVNAIGPTIDARRMKLIDRLKNSGMLSMLGRGYQETSKYSSYQPEGWPNLNEVISFLHAVDSHPYVFGAVGPGAYDCSGLVGEVWARLTGHPSYHRYFTTGNEANFFDPGPGMFTVGVTNNATTQHTAGRLRGLKFEARDTQEGIIIGPQAKDPESFAHVYHLKENGTFPTGPGGGSGDVGASGHLSPSAARRAGMTLMPSGWDWADLNNVFNRESGWRWNATGASTPLGRAYGIPQSPPGSKMGSSGSDWHDNAVTQIKWGLGYIKDRYGNPTKARQHEDAFNWYDQGGVLPPGPSLTMNGTGKPEAVFTQDQISKLIANNNGLQIQNLNLQIDMSKIDDVQKFVGILNELPQAIRAQRAGSIRKVNR